MVLLTKGFVVKILVSALLLGLLGRFGHHLGQIQLLNQIEIEPIEGLPDRLILLALAWRNLELGLLATSVNGFLAFDLKMLDWTCLIFRLLTDLDF